MFFAQTDFQSVALYHKNYRIYERGHAINLTQSPVNETTWYFISHLGENMYNPKFYRAKEREANIAFDTAYNRDPNHPLAKKAREYRKQAPSISRKEAFELAESELKKEGYKLLNL